MPDLTAEKKCSIEVLSVLHFYKLFLKEKKKYPPSLFCVDKVVKKKRKEDVSFIVFKKIIMNYLTVYFYNLYMNFEYSYFPLGGFIKKVVYRKWIKNTKKAYGDKKAGGNNSIGFFWYMRPNQKMYFMVKFIKLTGSTSKMAQLENLFLKNYDKDLLPIFIDEFIKGKKHKTLYQCTQT